MISMLTAFEDIQIQSIHRALLDVSNSQFGEALNFIQNKFDVMSVRYDELPVSGYIDMFYNNEGYRIKLIELLSDLFWNNDVYRLNTQIITQAFRAFDSGRIKYIDDIQLQKELKRNKGIVYFRLAPMKMNEFIKNAEEESILPPKTTYMLPKCPSFLFVSKYK